MKYKFSKNQAHVQRIEDLTLLEVGWKERKRLKEDEQSWKGSALRHVIDRACCPRARAVGS